MNKGHNKVQRGRGNKKFQITSIVNTNAAGLKSKINSLSSKIRKLNIPFFTIQETHCKTKGKINISEYVIFESIRTNKKNGGTAIGIYKSLKSVLIQEYSGEFELPVVEVKVSKMDVRIISGYGHL